MHFDKIKIKLLFLLFHLRLAGVGWWGGAAED